MASPPEQKAGQWMYPWPAASNALQVGTSRNLILVYYDYVVISSHSMFIYPRAAQERAAVGAGGHGAVDRLVALGDQFAGQRRAAPRRSESTQSWGCQPTSLQRERCVSEIDTIAANNVVHRWMMSALHEHRLSRSRQRNVRDMAFSRAGECANGRHCANAKGSEAQ